jgi:tetratricopeptide (TPR) repeat protein
MKRELPRDREFTHTLCDKAAERASGIATATRGKLRRIFCFDKGWLVFASSNLIEEQFGEYLVRSGALSPGARAESAEQAAREGKKLSQVLLESGRPPAEALRRGMEGLVRELFSSTLEWPDGQSQFQSGSPRLDGEVTVRLEPRSLVLAHVKRYPATVDALRIRIGPPDLRPVAAASGPNGLSLDSLGEHILRASDGSHDLAAILKDAPAEEERTLRTIYAFLLMGLLEPEDAGVKRARDERSTEGVELTREECLGRLALSSGHDHYAVLGLDHNARRDQIREAYYALARRYHPDRFRAGALSDLLSRFEEFFIHVTEAYNTLFDPERRAEYDQQQAAAPVESDARGSDTAYLARQNFLRGKALAGHRKFVEAVTFLENAIQLDPGQAEYHLELGLVLSRNPRRREDAERHLLQAIDLAPTLVAGYVALGQMYLRAGHAGRASRMAREALRWEPGNAAASALLAEAGNLPDEAVGPGSRAIFGRS